MELKNFFFKFKNAKTGFNLLHYLNIRFVSYIHLW